MTLPKASLRRRNRCKLLHLGSSFGTYFISMPGRPSNDIKCVLPGNYGEIRALRGLFGTFCYSTAGASFMSAVRAVLQYKQQAA